MSDRKLIVSVLGFDLTSNVVDEHNQLIKRGIGSTVYKFKGGPNLNNRVINKAYWTNYNEKLLNKILDYRRNND
jgi:hypothetical protein